MAFEQGPYVQLACFCERVLEQKDGVLSLIRVINRVTQSATGPEAPREMPPFVYRLSAVIALRSGQARGRHEVKIVRELPSGLKDTERAPTFTVHLTGQEQGHNIVVNIEMPFEQEGLYWFDVLFDDELLTRMPLRVSYTRMIPGA